MPDETKPAGFMEEDNGNKSSMRLMCFISLLSAIGWAVLVRMSKFDMTQYDIIIFMGLLLGAFAPKAIQKFAEQQAPVVVNRLVDAKPATQVTVNN